MFILWRVNSKNGLKKPANLAKALEKENPVPLIWVSNSYEV